MWTAAFPDRPPEFGFDQQTALGLRQPMQRTLGTTAQIAFAALLSTLEEDAAALADAYSDEQKWLLGEPVSRTPLSEAHVGCEPREPGVEAAGA